MKNIIIIGGGGHFAVLRNILNNNSITPTMISLNDGLGGEHEGIKKLEYDDKILSYRVENTSLVNAIGIKKNLIKRNTIYKYFKDKDYNFLNLVDEYTIIKSKIKQNTGIQIMAGSIIQVNCQIDENCIINTGSIIEHDCKIGGGTFIGPGATICGNVEIGSGSFIGAGATVVNNIKIAENSFVKANSLIKKNI